MKSIWRAYDAREGWTTNMAEINFLRHKRGNLYIKNKVKSAIKSIKKENIPKIEKSKKQEKINFILTIL